MGELTVGGGGLQQVTLHHFNPLGVNLGSSGGWAGSSGLQPPLGIATDPLDHVLFAYSVSATGGFSSGSAAERTLNGQSVQGVSHSWSAFNGSKFYPGTPIGDSAGRLAITASIAPACSICFPPDPGIDFGNGPETGDLLLRYDAAGNYLGSIPSAGAVGPADAAGNRYVQGSFQGTTDVGCGPLVGGPGSTSYLSKRDFDGTCLWSKTFPTGAWTYVVGADQNLELVFLHSGAIDLGAGPTPDGGAQNLTIARLDLAGNLIMSKTFGGAASAFSAVSIDSNDTGILLLTSKFSGVVDLGAGPLNTASGDTLIASLDPSGALRWSKVVNVGPPGNFGLGGWFKTARQPCGMVIATSSATVDLGSGPIVPPQQANAFSPNVGIAVLGL